MRYLLNKQVLFATATALALLYPFSGKRCQLAYAETRNIYRSVMEQSVEVTADILNIRTGAGTKYPIIGVVKSGQVLDVLGAIGNWYVICMPDESIGVISREFVKIHRLQNDSGATYRIMGANDETGERENYSLTADYDEDNEKLFRLMNKSRIENALKAFEWDEKLNTIAKIKADDMVGNNYFGHYSQLYGTPFEMLKQFETPYKNATENIIGNISIESAHKNIMADTVYRGNVLNTYFDKVGIGVADSPIYGKIIVQIFLQSSP